MKERLLISVCGRAGSKGFANKNLKNFCGHPLVYYTLSAAELFATLQTSTRVMNLMTEPVGPRSATIPRSAGITTL